MRFVNELGDVVRFDRSLLEIRRERLNLVEVVQQAAASVQPLVEGRRHVLTLAAPHQPIFVEGDANRLNQVVSNMLENAAKYTEPGGQITLTLEQQGDEAVLSVRDNGVGIAQSDLGRIFEPFTQVDSPLRRSGGGLGLGLSLVRRVLGLHGGRIEARSGGLSTGSEFIVWLPTVPHRKTAAPQQKNPAKASASVSLARKVLIVDDHEEVVVSLRRLIGRWGHEVAVARDAASAMELVSSFQPDCALVDLGLPDVSGYELAGMLRQALPARRLLLIAYTGSANPKVHEKCRVAGFDACLLKPGDPDVLEQLLQGVGQVDDVAG